MLLSYYNENKKYYNEILENNKSIEELTIYFNLNKIDLYSSNNYIYYKLLEKEIECCIKNNYKTSFMIEVDQKSSCAVFLSLILKNKKLAELSNLLKKEESHDIPRYLASKTKCFFDKINIKNEKLLKKFESNRNMHKKAFMTFCYNQEHYNRKKDWINSMTYEANEQDYHDLQLFSMKYENFLNEIFPKLIAQKKLLNELCKVLIKNYKNIIIKTLDESVIQWQIFKTKKSNIKFKSHFLKKFIPHKVKKLETGNIDIKKMETSFIPGLIHSIDASIMRFLILKIYYKNNYIINHVHDSVMINPKFVDSLYQSIEEIYTSECINKNILDEVFIKPSLNVVNEDSERKIKEIHEKLIKIQDDFSIISNNFDPRIMYPFE